ncbi:MAG: hypothetical protein B6I20_04745, partial [Bacteroidetes bacterium 4572_117]
MKKIITSLIFLFLLQVSCTEVTKNEEEEGIADSTLVYRNLLKRYKVANLEIDLSTLSDNEKQMIPVFIEISKIIDEIFWYQSFGNKDSLCKIKGKEIKELIKINFGPWDRFNNNKAFLNCVGVKPDGANFYPHDMKKEEFLSFEDGLKKSPYTFIRRKKDGQLKSVPYSIALDEHVLQISVLLKKAALLSGDINFRDYLLVMEEAFRTDNYKKSDIAWLKTGLNQLDFIASPIETFDDQLFGYKSEYESFLMIRDTSWTKRLAKYALMLPFLQKALPVEKTYRHESPNFLSELVVYNIINWGGAAKAGGYSISVSYPEASDLPDTLNNRNIHFINAIKQKYLHIIKPIADVIIEKDQQKYCTFEAFFLNNIFGELGLHLGIKNVLTTDVPVRESLKEYASVFEHIKGSVMQIYIAEKLFSVGEIEDLNEIYSAFLVDLFRTIRFSKSNPFPIAKTVVLNYLIDKQAIKISKSKKYSVDNDKMHDAIPKLINKVITIQG